MWYKLLFTYQLNVLIHFIADLLAESEGPMPDLTGLQRQIMYELPQALKGRNITTLVIGDMLDLSSSGVEVRLSTRGRDTLPERRTLMVQIMQRLLEHPERFQTVEELIKKVPGQNNDEKSKAILARLGKKGLITVNMRGRRHDSYRPRDPERLRRALAEEEAAAVERMMVHRAILRLCGDVSVAKLNHLLPMGQEVIERHTKRALSPAQGVRNKATEDDAAPQALGACVGDELSEELRWLPDALDQLDVLFEFLRARLLPRHRGGDVCAPEVGGALLRLEVARGSVLEREAQALIDEVARLMADFEERSKALQEREPVERDGQIKTVTISMTCLSVDVPGRS